MTIFTEKKTSLLYEVQLFEDFAMVKLATPGFESTLRRLSLMEFLDQFEEFWGDPDKVFEYIEDGVPPAEVN